jgi:ankyrin repeat protein
MQHHHSPAPSIAFDPFVYSGCDLNAVDNYGDCALKKAAFSGHAEFITVLLAAGANPDVCDGFMKSPLYASQCVNL